MISKPAQAAGLLAISVRVGALKAVAPCLGADAVVMALIAVTTSTGQNQYSPYSLSLPA